MYIINVDSIRALSQKATHCFTKERTIKFEATKRKVDELESKLNERDGKVSSLSKQCHQYKSELTEVQETLKKVILIKTTNFGLFKIQ